MLLNLYVLLKTAAAEKQTTSVKLSPRQLSQLSRYTAMSPYEYLEEDFYEGRLPYKGRSWPQHDFQPAESNDPELQRGEQLLRDEVPDLGTIVEKQVTAARSALTNGGKTTGQPGGLTPDEQRAVDDMYHHSVAPYQDKLLSAAAGAELSHDLRNSIAAAHLASLDTRIAQNAYARDQLPGTYWLGRGGTGPLRELMLRLRRRDVAGRQDSTGLARMLAVLRGGAAAQDRLREYATSHGLYAPAAHPQSGV